MRANHVCVFAALAVAGCGPISSFAPSPPSLHEVPAAIPAAKLKFTTFTAGKTTGFLSSAFSWDIAAARSGNVWFTDKNTPAIGRITASGRVKEFQKGLQPGGLPWSIVAGPDGNMWFTDAFTGAIGRVTPGGTIKEFTNPAFAGAGAYEIVVGSDNALWAMEYYNQCAKASFLARVTTDGTVSRIALPTMCADGSLAAGADGAFWFLATSRKGRDRSAILLVERRADGSLVEHKTGLAPALQIGGSKTAARHLTLGADARPWFTTLSYAKESGAATKPLATFQPPKGLRFYRLIDRQLGVLPAFPNGIANDGTDLWLTGTRENVIAPVKGALFRVKSDGSYESYTIPYTPYGITWSAPAVWFTAGSQIVEARSSD